MPSTVLSSVLTVVAVAAALACPIAVSAQSDEIMNGIAPAGGAPFTITSCKIARLVPFWHGAVVTLVNRTKHQLLSADVTLRFFDSENTLIGQDRIALPISSPLASTDNAAYNGSIYVTLAEPASAVTKIECRPTAASFTGDKKWVYGQTWPEKLLPIPKPVSDSGSGGGDAALLTPSAPKASAPRFQIAVVNSWNDTDNGMTIVHDTLSITGGSSDAQLHAPDLMLSMTLPGGARRTYYGLANAAPTYQKIVPGVGTTTAFEVAPANDLGRLGAITIPAHGTVTTTVTFLVTEPVATPTDNRMVSVR